MGTKHWSDVSWIDDSVVVEVCGARKGAAIGKEGQECEAY